jgi:arylsulfatase A-like enzyme
MLASLLLVCHATSQEPAVAAKPARPNVLLLYADDWRHDTLGCAGHPVVRTPQLDQLARDGVRFTHANVTTAVCGISRASLLTGQWMSRHGCRDFGTWQTPWAETLPGLLRANGYHTGHVGKWHNGAFPADRYDVGMSYHGKHWYPDGKGGRLHVTQRNERDALAFLRERPKDRPFALTVAFFATHAVDGDPEQFLPQPASMALYEDVDIPVPANANEASWRRLPPFFTDANEGRNRWRWRFDTPEKYQRMMKNYLRLASEVDAACGRIVAELAAQGVLEQTIVVFTTDNGYYHGEHGLADKWYPHQESIRVPLIVRDPRLPTARRGVLNDELVLSVDVTPTLLAAAGIQVPAGMQGSDMSQLYLASVPPPWRSEFFYEHPTLQNASFIPASRALVQKDWKYIVWPEHDVEQLFHLAADPQEERDVAGDAAHAERLVAMRARLRELGTAAAAATSPRTR